MQKRSPGGKIRPMHPFPAPPSLPRQLALAVACGLAMILAACNAPPRSDTVDVRPSPASSSETSSAAPAQCVPEGGSCAEPGARCCAGSTCASIGRPVCIIDY